MRRHRPSCGGRRRRRSRGGGFAGRLAIVTGSSGCDDRVMSPGGGKSYSEAAGRTRSVVVGGGGSAEIARRIPARRIGMAKDQFALSSGLRAMTAFTRAALSAAGVGAWKDGRARGREEGVQSG